MANVTNKLQMTDGTICDIFEWELSLNNLDLTILDLPQSRVGIKNKIRAIVPSFSSTTNYNRPVFVHGLVYGDSVSRTYNTPVSGMLRYGTDTSEDTDSIVLVYIDIPGYTLEVYNSENVRVRKVLSLSDLKTAIVRPDVTVTPTELTEIVNVLKNGGELLYFHPTSYFNIKSFEHMYIPQGSAPVPISIREWFSDNTKIGTFNMLFVLRTISTGTPSVATVTFNRNAQGNIYNIQVGNMT